MAETAAMRLRFRWQRALRYIRGGEPARVDADDEGRLVVRRAEQPVRVIDLTALDWVAFVFIGGFLTNEDGWWLLGTGDTAFGIWMDCPIVDRLLRYDLAAAIDAIGDLSVMHSADPPRLLRKARRNGGTIELDGAALAALRRETRIEAVAGVRAIPCPP